MSSISEGLRYCKKIDDESGSLSELSKNLIWLSLNEVLSVVFTSVKLFELEFGELELLLEVLLLELLFELDELDPLFELKNLSLMN